MTKNDYLDMRNKYLPEEIKTIFILESPPISGKYFYNVNGRVTEPLFAGMMKLLNFQPETKEEGLSRFAAAGKFLVDATYSPVNKLKSIDRNLIILQDFEELICDLTEIKARKAEMILVKTNVCKLLEPMLKNRGFNVLNNGEVIPFPACGHQRQFIHQAQRVMATITLR